MAATVLFSVFVLCLLQHVFARNCDLENIVDSCNECIRCGGIWCTDPNEEIRCALDSDSWCTSHRVNGLSLPSSELEGAFFKFKHYERSVKVGTTERIELTYSAKQQPCSKIDVNFVNSTIPDEFSGNFVIQNRTKHQNEECIYTIDAKPNTHFCPPYGISEEYVTFRIRVEGAGEEVTVRYHVPCACDCSLKVEKMSPKCSGRGDFACGACSCHNGWGGITCEEKPTVHCDRGDIPRCTNPNTDTICSNNGVCGPCGTCECFYDKAGSHYYDEYCADVCSAASDCDNCLRNPKPGQCDDCHNLYMEPYNKSFMGDMFTVNRMVWIECTERTEYCDIKYAARKDSRGELHVMMIDSCSPIAEKYGVGGVKIIIPAVLGVIALAAVAATAGFLAWKHRSPPMALTNSNYDHIDAEECTGENPLYKPPTSSFKNPTYGKW